MVGPWRISNLWHLTCSRRQHEAGFDLYGRPTESSWFHIDQRKRLRVTLLLIGNIIFQLVLQSAAIYYYSYELDQTAPGIAIGLSMMLLSIGCAITGGIYSQLYEHELHLKDPDRFPPNPILHAIERLKRRKRNRRIARKVLLIPRS